MGTKVFRRSIAVCVVATALGTVVASLALACVPQPVVTLEPPGSGPAGSEVTVHGVVFLGAVEVRWNSLDGPLLAKAEGPDFTTSVKIPDSPPGLYSLIALERDAGGVVGNKAVATFLVTGGDGAATAAPAQGNTADGRQEGSAGESAQDGVDPALALVGGAGLLALGGLAGAVVSRRRTRTSPVQPV